MIGASDEWSKVRLGASLPQLHKSPTTKPSPRTVIERVSNSSQGTDRSSRTFKSANMSKGPGRSSRSSFRAPQASRFQLSREAPWPPRRSFTRRAVAHHVASAPPTRRRSRTCVIDLSQISRYCVTNHPLQGLTSAVTEMFQIGRCFTFTWCAGRDLNPEPVD
jgi:hypothetical protein